MSGLTTIEGFMSNDVLPVAIIIAFTCFLCWLRTAILRIGRRRRPGPFGLASRSPAADASLLQHAEQTGANAVKARHSAHFRVVDGETKRRTGGLKEDL